MTREERIKSLKEAIDILKKMLSELELEQAAEGWHKEAAELRKEFPDFNLREEAETNKDFCEWLAHGASVRDAYLKTH